MIFKNLFILVHWKGLKWHFEVYLLEVQISDNTNDMHMLVLSLDIYHLCVY